jgi:serine/threonine protein kinase
MPEFSGMKINQGRYLLLDKLGSGAYGKVYRALDTTSPSEKPRYYAIKCLLRHPPGSDKDALQKREISIHQRVSGHPNIVSFHGWFYDDCFVYVVMGLYTGGDLFGAITEKRLFDGDPEKIKATFVQILEAVQHCHNLGVYHRDVKPENIICSEDGNTVYLGDFGLSTTRPMSLDYGCGSSFYMSPGKFCLAFRGSTRSEFWTPECIGPSATGKRGLEYSNRYNDIWALGVILTNLITSRNPWRLATGTDPCFSAYMENRNFLKEVLPISAGINAILQRVFFFPEHDRLSILELRRYITAVEDIYDESKRPVVGNGAQADTVTKAQDVPGAESKSDSNETWFSSLDSQYIHDAPDADADLSVEESPTAYEGSDPSDFLAPPAPPTRSSTPARGSGNSDESSGTDASAGPITPASNAVDPKVAIPDVSEEMGGAPDSVITKALVNVGENGEPDKQEPKATFFKATLEKLKAL